MLDVNVDGVHTNIIMVQVVKPGLTAKAFCRRLEMVNFLHVLSLRVFFQSREKEILQSFQSHHGYSIMSSTCREV